MPRITIGMMSFGTKAEAERHIRAILEDHRPASGCRQLSTAGADFAKDLLDLHPHRDIVIGPGIDSFHCQLIEKNALRFLLKRVDGTLWDFSWRNCLTPPTPAKRLAFVLRSEIQEQIEEYRNGIHFPIKCPISGEVIHRNNCHIDHEYPDTFAALAEKWLRLTGYSPDSIKLLHKSQYGGRSSIKDRVIANQWRTYHRSKARLRAVSAFANLSTLRKGKP